jgi:GH15 family glucan-1,4-alpha-glucosidase
MSSRIEDYALIGDCTTAALVGRDGSVDWLCWPRFDSDACFAALLGDADHGRWRIAPRDQATRVSRRYRGDTLILETRFECSEGAVTLIDFMRCAGRIRISSVSWSASGGASRCAPSSCCASATARSFLG